MCVGYNGVIPCFVCFLFIFFVYTKYTWNAVEENVKHLILKYHQNKSFLNHIIIFFNLLIKKNIYILVECYV